MGKLSTPSTHRFYWKLSYFQNIYQCGFIDLYCYIKTSLKWYINSGWGTIKHLVKMIKFLR